MPPMKFLKMIPNICSLKKFCTALTFTVGCTQNTPNPDNKENNKKGARSKNIKYLVLNFSIKLTFYNNLKRSSQYYRMFFTTTSLYHLLYNSSLALQ